MHLKLIGLGQYSHGGGRGVHAALRLCGRHTLDTMDARLIFQRAIDIGSADGEVNLLVAAYGTLANTGHAELPTLRVAETLIHLEEVAGKEASLVTARSCTDLHLHVLRVLRILRDEGNLDLFFELRLQSLVFG